MSDQVSDCATLEPSAGQDWRVSLSIAAPLITAGTTAAIAGLTWAGAKVNKRRNRRKRNGDLATDLIAAVTTLAGEVTIFHETWTRRRRRNVLLAAGSDFLAGGGGKEGFGAALRTALQWERDSTLAVRPAMMAPSAQVTAVYAQLSFSGSKPLRRAAADLVDEATTFPTSTRQLKRYQRRVEESAEVFGLVARQEAGLEKRRRLLQRINKSPSARRGLRGERTELT